MSDRGYTFERVIETVGSSSNLVVRGAPFGMEITLEPMVEPVERIDVYDEEADEFANAVLNAYAEVRDGG